MNQDQQWQQDDEDRKDETDDESSRGTQDEGASEGQFDISRGIPSSPDLLENYKWCKKHGPYLGDKCPDCI